jgi:hypothetical protein
LKRMTDAVAGSQHRVAGCGSHSVAVGAIPAPENAARQQGRGTSEAAAMPHGY